MAADDEQRIRALHERAEALYDVAPTESVALSEEAIALATRVEDDRLLAESYALLGWANFVVGRPDLAVTQLDDALERYREVGSDVGISKVLSMMGAIRCAHGELSEGIDLLNSALSVASACGDKQGEAAVLMNLGAAYSMVGRHSDAIELLQDARALYEELGMASRVCDCDGNLGVVFSSRGDYARAVECFESALSGAEALDKPLDAILWQGGLADVFRQLGESDTAITYYESALARSQGLGSLRYVTGFLCNLGDAHLERGELQTALSYFESALELASTQSDDRGLELAHGNLGEVHLRLGDQTLAIKYLERACTIGSELGSRELHRWLGLLGQASLTEGSRDYDAARAEELFLQTLDQADASEDRRTLCEVHHCLAGLYQRSERWEEAYRHLSHHNELKSLLLSDEARRQAQGFEYRRRMSAIEKERAIERAEAEAAELRACLLESRLERKEQELVSTAMHLARQTELLARFRNDLRTIARQIPKTHPAVRALNEKLNELPCASIDWAKFEAEFRQTYPQFQSKLLERWPTLSGMELKVCSLLRLRLTSADISRLLCVSERGVEFHRLNIRRKLGMERGQDLRTVLAGV